MPIGASPQKPWLLLHWATLQQQHDYGIQGYVMASYIMPMLWLLLWLLCQPGENKPVCISYAP